MIKAARFPRVARGLIAVISLVISCAAVADDELLLYVYDGATPVEGALIELDGSEVGVTRRDGSLMADLAEGQHTISVSAPSGKTSIARFAAGSGQLVDVISDLGSAGPAYVEVYSRLESSADRRRAPTGTLQVTVRVGANGIPDQTVEISGGQASIVTDREGVAAAVIPRGIYRLSIDGLTQEARVVGGITRAVTVVLPEPGEEDLVSPTLEEVFVVASFDPSGLEVSERDASNIVDTIGVELLARYSDSDVAASVVRVPGISVQDNKYVFIRGLGGRYVSSTLNNATMPSTNPSKRTVPLDLFPSNFVNQLDIKKTFLPFMPGESSGGTLVINTKTFPDERVLSLRGSLGFVAGLTGEDVFTDPIDGSFDSIGWDDGAREEDALVSAIADVLSVGRLYDEKNDTFWELDASTEGELRRAGALLIKDGFDLDFQAATPEGSLGIDFGDVFYFGNSELGIYAAANYSNEWSQRDKGVRRTYTGAEEDADNFAYRQYSNNVEASGLISIGLNTGNNTFEWNNLVSRVTQSILERSVGEEGDEFQTVYAHTIQWEERQFLSSQLVGSHFLTENGSVFLEWQFTGSQARRYAPDRREVEFRTSGARTDSADLRSRFDFNSANTDQPIDLVGFRLEPGTILRRYDDLVDNNFDFSADLTWDVFDNGSTFGRFQAGLQAIYRERDSDVAVYGFNINQARESLLRADNALVSEVVYVCGEGPGTVACQPAVSDTGSAPPVGGITDSPDTGLVFNNKTLASDSYEADLSYNSVYAMYDHTWASVWNFVVGARFEMYEQTTDTFSLQGEQASVQSVIDEDSVLPSLGINWFYSDTQQLRLAVSQTVARPDFKEAANATFYDNEFNFRVRGNPFLTISEVINADLRWEWYPNEVDSLSVAVFYKDMDDPIERVVQLASGTAGNSRTFQNSESAELYGAEVEGRKEFNLGQDYTRTLFVAFNGAYIESEVTAQNQLDRELQGQPEYTTNLIVGYDDIASGHQLTLLFNYNGESIADVGIDQLPDVLLEARGELNLIYRYNLSEALTLQAKVENILNAEVEYTQGGRVFQRYEKGMGLQVAFNWEF